MRVRRSQLDHPTGRIGLAAKKQSGMAHGADARRTDLLLDLSNQLRALVPVRTFKAHFHQFAGIQQAGKLHGLVARKACATDFDRGVEALAEAAQSRFLRTSEGGIIHGPSRLHPWRGRRPPPKLQTGPPACFQPANGVSRS